MAILTQGFKDATNRKIDFGKFYWYLGADREQGNLVYALHDAANKSVDWNDDVREIEVLEFFHHSVTIRDKIKVGLESGLLLSLDNIIVEPVVQSLRRFGSQHKYVAGDLCIFSESQIGFLSRNSDDDIQYEIFDSGICMTNSKKQLILGKFEHFAIRTFDPEGFRTPEILYSTH